MTGEGANRKGMNPGDGDPSGGHPDALIAGTVLGEFALERVLGMGGFSFVYLAFDRTLERHVAIKEYLPSAYAMRCKDSTVAPRSDEHKGTFASGLRSFIEEARLLARFEHPALVKVLRFWEANGTAYMAMQYYQGRTLRNILRSDPAFATEARLKALIAPLLDAVVQLHAAKCYHRDIAPDNIIVQPSGAPVLLDFGAARRVIGDMTHALTVVLKPGFAPIEQYAEEGGPAQGPWTDVYAFAAVLYTAIAGKPPLAAVARAYSDALVPLARDPPTGYSLAFLRGIDAALAVRPEDRPQSIADFRASLGIGTEPDPDDTVEMLQPSIPTRPPAVDLVAATRPATAAAISRAPSPAISPVPPSRSRWTFVVAGAGALALVALAVVVYFTAFDDSSRAKSVVVTAGTQIPAPTPAPTPPAPTAVPMAPDPRDQVKVALAALECAHTSFELDAAGALSISGHVQDAGQQSALERQLRGIAGVTKLDSNLSFVPRPFCEVTSLVAGLRTLDSGSLQARVVKPKPPLRIGQQPVLVDVAAPDFAANIAVDVWSLVEKGPPRLEVAHLLPHAGYSLSDQFKANEKRTIDRISDGKVPQVIRVYPPAGRLLFTAIASDLPLVKRDRPLMEDPAQYLAALRADAEARGTNARIATWYGFVDVLP